MSDKEKPSLEDRFYDWGKSNFSNWDTEDRKTIQHFLLEAEQRGYQKGFKEAVKTAPEWEKVREENESGYLGLVETVTKVEVAWSNKLDLAVREARIEENQRWANGYASALLDNPEIADKETFRAAKADFEDRIKELKGE